MYLVCGTSHDVILSHAGLSGSIWAGGRAGRAGEWAGGRPGTIMCGRGICSKFECSLQCDYETWLLSYLVTRCGEFDVDWGSVDEELVHTLDHTECSKEYCCGNKHILFAGVGQGRHV